MSKRALHKLILIAYRTQCNAELLVVEDPDCRWRGSAVLATKTMTMVTMLMRMWMMAVMMVVVVLAVVPCQQA